MRGGSFVALSRKNSGKVPRTPINATVYVFISLVLVSILMLMLSSIGFITNAKNLGLSVFLGVRGGIYEFSSLVSRTALSVKELADLRKEHSELIKQLERYKELERSSAEIYQENIRLREQLNFSNTMRYDRIPAEISGRDPDNLFSSIVINRGSFSGVKNDMAVVAWQDGIQALVGKVIQTGTFESHVMPVFDVNSQVSARFSISRYEGIAEGQGNSEIPLLMRFVPKRARSEINIGDIVVSSGMGGIFPAGINIGRVNSVNVHEYISTLEVSVIPMIDFSKLEYVFVIVADAEAEMKKNVAIKTETIETRLTHD